VQWQRKRRRSNPVVPPAGTKRSAWVRSFQLQIYREITNSKKTVRPESIAKAVKKVFESNNAALAENKREHQDLSDRLQQLNYERMEFSIVLSTSASRTIGWMTRPSCSPSNWEDYQTRWSL